MVNRITNITPQTLARADLQRDCHAVLLPVVADFARSSWLEHLLAGGTSSILLGESRQEYVARAMSEERRATETAADFQRFVAAVAPWSRGPLLIAVDQEPWGIQRLHDLVAPSPDAMAQHDLGALRDAAGAVATDAKALGVSMFLAPVLDVLDGGNPWLEGRTLDGAETHEHVASVGAAVIAGTQRAGVAAAAKHFPGFPCVALDPALDAGAAVRAGQWDERALKPFAAAVLEGAAAVMLGPAIVEDLDADQPASTSRLTVDLLRERLGFTGLIVSDDLDAPATLLGRSLEDTMIDSLVAGADLLLVGGGEHLLESVRHIYDAACGSPALAARIHEAAEQVRRTARAYGVR